MSESGKTLAVIVSTMRSGSTLLKALLGQAPDVSQLPEVNFQRYRQASPQLWRLAPEPILLLKRPCWYHEVSRYPRLPEIDSLRVIVLVRDCYETVESLRRMSLGRWQHLGRGVADRWLARKYWAGVTSRLLGLVERPPCAVQLIRYEDLVNDPLRETARLFTFLGSRQAAGVNQYSEPQYRWRWGRDDNSPALRSLTVQPPKASPRENRALISFLAAQPQIQALRERLGYPPLENLL